MIEGLIKQFSYSFLTDSFILTFCIHYEFFWIYNTSKKIRRFVQHKLNNPNSLSPSQIQQKQHKQLLLTDSKNIFTYRFQQMQRLQPNCMTDSLRNLMFTKHNGDNAKVRIFSFILQRQPIQPNFMTDSMRRIIHNKQSNTQTQLER